MSLLTSASGGTHALLREDVGPLIIQPVRQMSVALRTATVVTTQNTEYRVPILKDDASASWIAEGAEITATDADFDETVVTPRKVAGLSIISRELAEDSAPSAQQTVGDGLAEKIARGVDAAFFGNTVTNGPSGLLSVTDVSTVDTGGTIANTDPFAEALSKAETVGGVVTAFVAHPDTVLVLSKVKKQTGSNEPLLGYDASQPTQRQVLGVPLIPSRRGGRRRRLGDPRCQGRWSCCATTSPSTSIARGTSSPTASASAQPCASGSPSRTPPRSCGCTTHRKPLVVAVVPVLRWVKRRRSIAEMLQPQRHCRAPRACASFSDLRAAWGGSSRRGWGETPPLPIAAPRRHRRPSLSS